MSNQLNLAAVSDALGEQGEHVGPPHLCCGGAMVHSSAPSPSRADVTIVDGDIAVIEQWRCRRRERWWD